MTDWRDRALCVGADPHDYDTEHLVVGPSGNATFEVKPDSMLLPIAAGCYHCPVWDACKTWAEREVRQSPDMNLIAAGAVYRAGVRQPWRKPKVA